MFPISFYTDYYVLFIFFFVSLVLSLILLGVTRTVSTGLNILDHEKLAAYECGFDPIETGRQIIDLKFYKVAILFIIFDIEIIFLLPWCITINDLDLFSLICSYYFMLILLLGLFIELQSSSLRW